MKTCNKCGESKPLFAFGKQKKSRDGLRYCCKVCNNKAANEWKQCNTERFNAYQSAYYACNKAKKAKTGKARYEANKPAAYSKAAKRRASKLQATPIWVDSEAIEAFYSAAIAFRLYTGQEFHVDHVVPLQGKTVCGLHVPANLQILTEAENKKKGHHVWPDMW